LGAAFASSTRNLNQVQTLRKEVVYKLTYYADKQALLDILDIARDHSHNYHTILSKRKHASFRLRRNPVKMHLMRSRRSANGWIRRTKPPRDLDLEPIQKNHKIWSPSSLLRARGQSILRVPTSLVPDTNFRFSISSNRIDSNLREEERPMTKV